MSVLYIGSYTEKITKDFGGKGDGIYTVKLNKETGVLTLSSTLKTTNPAYLAISDREVLYTITEVSEEKSPKVKAYKIKSDFSLEFINALDISGSLPCHIAYNDNSVLVACYGSGNILRFETNKNGTLIKQTNNFKHKGFSVNKERQEAPHAHQTVIHPNKTHAFVPDLGIDKVKVYSLEKNTIKEGYDINIPEGLGPRHMVFNKKGTLGYLINELTGDVSILKKKKKHFEFSKNVKSLPDSFTGTPGASALRIHPSKPFLYNANRSLDAITIFEITNDDLRLIGYQYSKGKTLREFNISPDGHWLIACLQDSNETVVYQIQKDGTLKEMSRTESFTSPVCVAFL